MCTVTYLPGLENNFIFTSNRDEAPSRNTTDLNLIQVKEKRLMYPKDPKSNGTWIAVSNTDQLVCILNGAFKKHLHHPPYRLSRGIMALDYFTYKNFIDFFQNFDFIGIEPFTMVVIDEGKLYEFRWNGEKKYLLEKDKRKPHIWASRTLYSEKWIQKRQKWFHQWLSSNKNKSQPEVLSFHKTAGEGNQKYDLVMNRKNIVQTVSITSISKNKNEIHLRHEDIVEDVVQWQSLI